jgi:type IV pilus assembly protein PilC
MKRYNYKAKDKKTGRVVSGSVQAENERAAGRILLEQGYIPQKVSEERKDGWLAKFQNRVSSKQRIIFTRQFATLISAGLPLSAALRMVAEQTEDKPTKAMVEDILAQVEGGKTLHDAFSKYPQVFNKVYLSLIAAGEASGTLDVSLQRLAEQQEKDAAMISKIRGAMTYPAIVLLVIVVVIVFMMVAVVPQVENLYRDLGEELPWMTKVLVGMSNFVMNFWWLILVIVGIIVWFFLQFRKTDVGKKWLAVFKLNVPIFKGLFLRLYNARFARTAQMLLSAGVPMLEAMSISGEAINNIVLEDQIAQATTMVRSGKPLSVALKGRDYILPLLPQMAATGEQSGKIDEMLGKAAKVYEDELDERIAAISTMIEPILMVVLALVAGGIVGAVLFPIYNLVSKIGT